MKITKEQFENKILDHFENVTGVFGPTGLARVRKEGAWTYIDKRTGVTIATWCRGTGRIFDFSSDGLIFPRLKINLIQNNISLTTAGIYYSIGRKAEESK